MSTLSPALTRPSGDSASSALLPPTSFRHSLRAAVALYAAGAVALSLAATQLVPLLHDSAPSAAPVPVTVTRPGDIAVVRQVYEPGQGSDWHAHAGVHAVAIIAGSLTVYDEHCRAETFGPGRPYIGGQQLHRERNETAEPVELVVTFISSGTPASPARTESVPACGVTNNG